MVNDGSRFYGWKLVAVLWLVVLINGALPMYGLSVLDTHMADQFGFERTVTGSAYSVFIIMSGVPCPLIAIGIDRWGAKATIVGGSLLLAVGASAMATFVSTPTMLLLFAGAVVGTASAAGSILPIIVVMTAWFRHRRTLAIALVMSGLTIGGIACPPLLEKLISESGGNWRSGWWAMALLALVAAVLTFVFSVDEPAHVGQAALGTDREERASPLAAARVHITREIWTFREVVRMPSYWALIAISIVAMAGFTLFFGQGILHMRDLGYSIGTAAYFTSAFVAIGLVTHMLTGLMGDRIDPRHQWVLGMAAQGIGMALFADAGSPALLALSIALMGGGTSVAMLCVVAVMSNWYGHHAYASVAGLSSAVATIGALSSSIGGFSYDHWGTAAPAYYGVGALCVMSGAWLAALRPPRGSARSLAAGAPSSG